MDNNETKNVEQENANNVQETNIFGQVEEKEVKPQEEVTEEVKEEKKEEQEETYEPVNATVNGDIKVVKTYKKQKEMGPLPVILFFTFVGILIIFLPQIQEYIRKYNVSKIPIVGSVAKDNNQNTTQNENEQPTDENVTYEKFNNNTVVSIKSITLNNFSKKDVDGKKYLTMTLTNKNNTTYSYKDNIYIELYNANKKLLSRNLLEGDRVPGSSSGSISLLINEEAFSEVSLMVIKEIKKEDYASITLEENPNGLQELTCKINKDDVITYTFDDYKLVTIDEKLKKIQREYSVLEDYQNDLLTYKQKASVNSTYEGVSASFLEDSDKNEFSYAIKVDLSSISETEFSKLNSKYYYSYQTEAKVVAFEMQARGYDCK